MIELATEFCLLNRKRYCTNNYCLPHYCYELKFVLFIYALFSNGFDGDPTVRLMPLHQPGQLIFQ